VVVALFEVSYEDGRPYADVVLPGADLSYSPMARLTLARYQEHSLPGLELSAMDDDPSGCCVAVPDSSRRTTVGRCHRHPQRDRSVETPNRVEVRLEVAPSPQFGEILRTLSDGAAAQGWQQLSTALGVLNQPLAPIQISADGRTCRLVGKEIENLEPLDSPSTGDVLVLELGRRVVFADVVQL
jgi:hypothetical protein